MSEAAWVVAIVVVALALVGVVLLVLFRGGTVDWTVHTPWGGGRARGSPPPAPLAGPGQVDQSRSKSGRDTEGSGAGGVTQRDAEAARDIRAYADGQPPKAKASETGATDPPART
jgi:hypothetical protein